MPSRSYILQGDYSRNAATMPSRKPSQIPRLCGSTIAANLFSSPTTASIPARLRSISEMVTSPILDQTVSESDDRTMLGRRSSSIQARPVSCHSDTFLNVAIPSVSSPPNLNVEARPGTSMSGLTLIGDTDVEGGQYRLDAYDIRMFAEISEELDAFSNEVLGTLIQRVTNSENAGAQFPVFTHTVGGTIPSPQLSDLNKHSPNLQAPDCQNYLLGPDRNLWVFRAGIEQYLDWTRQTLSMFCRASVCFTSISHLPESTGPPDSSLTKSAVHHSDGSLKSWKDLLANKITEGCHGERTIPGRSLDKNEKVKDVQFDDWPDHDRRALRWLSLAGQSTPEALKHLQARQKHINSASQDIKS